MKTFEQIKKNISSDYCKSIVIIDDNIFDKRNDSPPFTTVYNELYNSASTKGILCHFYQYVSEDESLKTATNLCSNANLIILDWYLSESSKSEPAIKLIENILEKNEIRFLIIYTNESISKVQDTLFNKFPKLLNMDSKESKVEKPAVEGEEDSELEIISDTDSNIVKSFIQNDPVYFRLNNLFIGIHHKKTEFEAHDGQKLLRARPKTYSLLKIIMEQAKETNPI